MYVDLHSFNARVKHERLWEYSITFTTEERAKLSLIKTKNYNKDKDVIYTCCTCDNNDSFNKIAWIFAYTCLNFVDELDSIIGGIKVCYTTISPAECPYRNSGELI